MNKTVAALREEIKNRARIYYLIYKELAKELGEEKTEEILRRAIYQRGKEKGARLAEKVGSPDIEKLAKAFVEGKEGVDAFGHEVVEVGSHRALLRLNHCPLVEAWKEMGLSEEETKTLCDIAYQVDFGKFESAGYKLRFKCRIAEGGASCDLDVTK